MGKIFIAIALFLGIIIGSFSDSIIQFVHAQVVTGSVIEACVNDTTGTIRIVPNNNSCAGGESPVDWRKLQKGEGSFPFICPKCQFNDMADMGTLLKGKDLTGAFVPYALIGSPTNSLVDMSNVILSKSNISNTSLIDVKLDNSTIKNANLYSVIFTNPLNLGSAVNVNFTGSSLSDLNANDNNFSGSNFTSTNLSNAVFRSSNLSNANFNNALVHFTRFENSNLTGATNLTTASRIDVVWINTICPDGTNSDTNGGTCEGHL